MYCILADSIIIQKANFSWLTIILKVILLEVLRRADQLGNLILPSRAIASAIIRKKSIFEVNDHFELNNGNMSLL